MPKKNINYKSRAALIRRFETLPFNNRTRFNSTQKRLITRKYNHYRRFNGIRHIKTDKKTIKQLKSRGYAITKKGVFIDDVRDGVGNKIPGSTVQLLNHNIIKVTLRAKGQRKASRIDYIYNFNQKEKLAFVESPEKFVINLIKSIPVLKANFDINILKTKPARQHIRFQIGAYGTHSALSLDVLDFYIKEKAGNEKTKGFFDVITGLRFVKFMPITPKKKKAKKKKAKKKTNRSKK